MNPDQPKHSMAKDTSSDSSDSESPSEEYMALANSTRSRTIEPLTNAEEIMSARDPLPEVILPHLHPKEGDTTAPLYPTAHNTSQSYKPLNSPDVELKYKRVKSKKGIVNAIVFFVVIIGGYIAFSHYQGNLPTILVNKSNGSLVLGMTKPLVIENDSLALASTHDSKYLRPSSWKFSEVNNVGAYEPLIPDSTGVATKMGVTISQTKVEAGALQLLASSDVFVDQLRQQYKAGLNNDEGLYKQLLSSPDKCGSNSTMVVTEDTTETDTYYGLATAEISCDIAKISVHEILGKDGRKRSAIIIAPLESWEKNRDTFNHMLRSIDQA